MVSAPRNEVDRDHGQLILVGAITLAFIILGLVIVVNGVLFTETLAPGSSGQSASDAATVERELEAGIAGIAHRGNLRWGESGYDEYNETLTTVVEDGDGFRGRYRNVTANSRPVITNVTVAGVPENQRARARTNRSVTGLSTPDINRQIGHLSFDLQSNADGGTVRVENATSWIEIREATVGTEDGFVIENEDGRTCEVGSDRAEIGLVTGAVNVTASGSCDRRFIDPSASTELSITGDGNTSGTYDLVVKNDGIVLGGGSPAAWAVDTTVTYESNDVSYRRSQRIFLYGDRS